MRLRNDCIHSLCIGVTKVSKRMPERNICIVFGLKVPGGLAHVLRQRTSGSVVWRGFFNSSRLESKGKEGTGGQL